MSRKGWTETIPCPGCKKIVGRPKDSVCNECAFLIEDGEKFRKNTKKMKNKKDVLLVTTPDNWCVPRFFSHVPRGNNWKERNRIEEFLGKTLQILANHLTDHQEKDHFAHEGFNVYNWEWDWAVCGYMRKDVAGLLRRLPIYIKKLLDVRERDAYNYGCNMLQRFASGDITEEELNKFSIRKNGKI